MFPDALMLIGLLLVIALAVAVIIPGNRLANLTSLVTTAIGIGWVYSTHGPMVAIVVAVGFVISVIFLLPLLMPVVGVVLAFALSPIVRLVRIFLPDEGGLAAAKLLTGLATIIGTGVLVYYIGMRFL